VDDRLCGEIRAPHVVLEEVGGGRTRAARRWLSFICQVLALKVHDNDPPRAVDVTDGRL